MMTELALNQIDQINVVQVAGIFQRISETSSKNDKIAIIENNKKNTLFLEILRFVYDDFIRTGISTKKITLKNIPTPDEQFDSLLSLMDYVKENNTGKLQVVSNIKEYIKQYHENVRNFLYDVFSKHLKVGITAKSVNKALGKGFLREFGCQLAHPFKKYGDKVQGNEFILTQKLDGHRCIAIYDKAKTTFYTRKGLEINSLDRLALDMSDLASRFADHDGTGIVLDGELLLEDDGAMETKDLFRATSRVLKNTKADKTRILFNIFDWVPLEEFIAGESIREYHDRRDKMDAVYSIHLKENPDTKVRLVKELYRGTDLNKIAELQRDLVDRLGWEGLMLNYTKGKYVTKRTPKLLKIKKFFNSDVLVKDVYEGTGINKGRLGGVVVQFKDFEVQVGSGFTEEERVKYWYNPNSVVGHIIDIQYFEETQNQDGGKGVRFPTFKSLRVDKAVEDISYES